MMDLNLPDIEKKFRTKSDSFLINILSTQRTDFQPKVIQLIEKILNDRGYANEINDYAKKFIECKVIADTGKLKIFQYPFKFKGRIGRKEFILSFLAVVFLNSLITKLIEEGNNFAVFIYIPTFWLLISQATKREHDLGFSGWWQLVPFRYFWLLFLKGEKFSNIYDLTPSNCKVNPSQYHSDTSVIIAVNEELSSLLFQLNTLETKLKDLSSQFAEIEKFIKNFNTKHMQELGSLILEILALKKSTTKNLEEKKEAEQDYASYTNDYHESIRTILKDLSPVDKIELKKAFREASKLCHPDKGSQYSNSDSFVKLTEAYNQNDLQAVANILSQLKSGLNLQPSVITDKEQIKNKITKLKEEIEKVDAEIGKTVASVDYLSIPVESEWENYFFLTKRNLSNQLSNLKNGTEPT